MKKKRVTCIICPIGCDITVGYEGENVLEISGNQCDRGNQYASKEVLNPTRILTTTVKVKNYHLPVISVRSNKPVPKELMFECMNILKNVEAQAPIEIGESVVNNILDTGIDIVVTKN